MAELDAFMAQSLPDLLECQVRGGGNQSQDPIPVGLDDM